MEIILTDGKEYHNSARRKKNTVYGNFIDAMQWI